MVEHEDGVQEDESEEEEDANVDDAPDGASSKDEMEDEEA
jgi:hypothetical protein